MIKYDRDADEALERLTDDIHNITACVVNVPSAVWRSSTKAAAWSPSGWSTMTGIADDDVQTRTDGTCLLVIAKGGAANCCR